MTEPIDDLVPMCRVEVQLSRASWTTQDDLVPSRWDRWISDGTVQRLFKLDMIIDVHRMIHQVPHWLKDIV
jgi:hypothetical protein